MVLGLRSKTRKGPSVHVDYLFHVQEIKPWPPSHSLISLRSVMLQWENGDRNSGSTNSVVPSLGSGVNDGKIEFNESFKLPVTLSREVSVKGGDADTFQKNCIELNLYELRRDKTVKGQLLGTVIVDLAEYGVLKEAVSISAPMNCKRSFRNTAQPVLFIKIQPFHRRNSSTSSRESLLKEAALDKDGRELVSTLMNGEYTDEAEIASFTDDDVSPHSSMTVSSSAFEATGGSPPQSEENALEAVEDSTGKAKCVPDLPLESVTEKPNVNPVTATQEHLTRISSHSSSIDSSSGVGSPENDQASLSNFHERSLSIAHQSTEEEAICNNRTESLDPGQLHVKEYRTSDLEAKVASTDIDPLVDDKACLVTSANPQLKGVDVKEAWGQRKIELKEASNTNGTHAVLMESKDGEKQRENGENEQTEEVHSSDVEARYSYSSNAIRNQEGFVGDAASSCSGLEGKNSTPTSIRLRHVKSVRSLLDSAKSNRVVTNGQFMGESKESISLDDAESGDRSFIQKGRKDTIAVPREARNSLSGRKVQQLEHRIEKLERELREAAALEVSLYSIVAEHGSSANKVHAPARRLSRLYLHAWKWARPRSASAARSAISGLVLVAKACGNDVPRLTFWLSNSVVLRAIISLAVCGSKLPVSDGPHIETNYGGKGNDKGSSPLKWEESYPRKQQNKFGFAEDVDDWEEPHTFRTALEKIEAWIFSRIIESVWWQTLTPHMQSASKASEQKINLSLRNSYGRKPSFGDQEQANFSMELWKKAFKDACERLCPVRAAGHECGCLPVLAKLVMEQCVSRLDVAMFNAILRESEDDIPTDPVSDPISDSKVLPIPAQKSSFGAGAQLKNAIGNWSRWLTDLFDIDDDDSHEVQSDLSEDDRQECDTSSKSFHLLNALSDLMMLPKDMLLSRSIRKEVCPTFGAPLIKSVLNHYSPDEFCPDPIPEEVYQALDDEDPLDAEEESIRNFPCTAAPIIYSPPSAALLAGIIGDAVEESHLRRSRSSVLRKSYTSDDELDELESPLTSITDSFRYGSTPSWKPKENGGPNVVRYQLLQEVWRDGD